MINDLCTKTDFCFRSVFKMQRDKEYSYYNTLSAVIKFLHNNLPKFSCFADYKNVRENWAHAY